jgi:NTP pyrophosphatase (non-canonical NTP hydrolase)
MITDQDAIKLYEKAWAAWGQDSQLAMLAEECAELIKASLKYSRKVNGSTIVDIAGEIADVEITIAQAKHCLGIKDDWISDIKQRKLYRLSELLKEIYQ